MPGKRPNILLITSDQQHWTTLGCINPEIHTPHLDRLASEGTRFTRAYCPNPTCTPTRASLITGLYPSQHGAYALGTKLEEEVPTLGDYLTEAGYDCTLIGKAHFQGLRSTEDYPSLESYPILRDLDFWRGYHGPFYGFSHIEIARNHADETHVGQHYALWMEQKGCAEWRKHFQNKMGAYDFSDGIETNKQYGRWSIPEELHYNTWIAERTQARMDYCQELSQPFFLWASFFDPHPPYLVPEPWDTMYDPAKLTLPTLHRGEHEANPRHFQKTQEANPDFSEYDEPGGNALHGFSSHLGSEEGRRRDMAYYYGMTSCMDAAIGRILEHLEARGLAEETLVVFTSDHGHLFGQHGMIAKGPFHYEDLVRVPMIVRQPGVVPQGKVSDDLQSLVDYAPTFLRAAGMEVPYAMTGKDQLEAWSGQTKAPRTHVVVENRHNPSRVSLRTYIDARYKLTVYQTQDDGELFDLQEDPAEVRNLWAVPQSQGLKAELMHKLLQAELAKERLPMPRVAGA